MNDSFNSLIESANSLQIVLPTRPFFDQVAAGLSLFLGIKPKKQVQIYSSSPMTVEFNRLVGVNKISPELGNKNLTLRFIKYPADNIERVSYDIEDSEFRLTVIPKPGIASPKKEQVDFSYSGVSADTAILIGGANQNHFPAILEKNMAGVKLLHVGTRELIAPSEKIAVLSFARPASSVSEIVASLLKDNSFEIDTDIATNLLMGIEEGSNKFSAEGVTAETFEFVAHLMKKGGKRRVQQKTPVRMQFPKRAIPRAVKPEDKSLFAMEQSEKRRIDKVKQGDKVPKDWTGPKIYKGDTIS
jgi:hypothetical protein